MDKWSAIAIIGIWAGISLCSIGLAVLVPESIGILKIVVIAGGICTFFIILTSYLKGD